MRKTLHYLLKHIAHLVQAAVWTAGLDDRLTARGLISFQLCKAYAPPVGVKGQISTVCLYTAGGNLASKDTASNSTNQEQTLSPMEKLEKQDKRNKEIVLEKTVEDTKKQILEVDMSCLLYTSRCV